MAWKGSGVRFPSAPLAACLVDANVAKRTLPSVGAAGADLGAKARRGQGPWRQADEGIVDEPPACAATGATGTGCDPTDVADRTSGPPAGVQIWILLLVVIGVAFFLASAAAAVIIVVVVLTVGALIAIVRLR